MGVRSPPAAPRDLRMPAATVSPSGAEWSISDSRDTGRGARARFLENNKVQLMVVRLALVVILLTAIFGGIFGWKYYQQQQAAAQQQAPPPATVAVHTVGLAPWQPELNAIGTLVSANG